MEELLISVINTLETVEVRGSTNMDSMLGSINALKSIVEALHNASDVPKEEEKEE